MKRQRMHKPTEYLSHPCHLLKKAVFPERAWIHPGPWAGSARCWIKPGRGFLLRGLGSGVWRELEKGSTLHHKINTHNAVFHSKLRMCPATPLHTHTHTLPKSITKTSALPVPLLLKEVGVGCLTNNEWEWEQWNENNEKDLPRIQGSLSVPTGSPHPPKQAALPCQASSLPPNLESITEFLHQHTLTFPWLSASFQLLSSWLQTLFWPPEIVTF